METLAIPTSAGSLEPDGRSDAIRRLRVQARSLARSRHPVLISGEIGTGKLRFARFLHSISERPALPFLRIACSEGVQFQRVLDEAPSNGTLVLEHIDEAPTHLQKSIARHLAAISPARASIRIMATSRRDLALEVLESRFQADLFFRLRVYAVEIPALRDRREDVSMLAHAILGEFAGSREFQAVPELTSEAIDTAMQYHWPGNVRQLQNELIRCATRSRHAIGRHILLEGLDDRIPIQSTRVERGNEGLSDRVDAYERQILQEVLARTFGNRDRAATMLGITRRTLQRKLVYHKRCGFPLDGSSRKPAGLLKQDRSQSGAACDDAVVAMAVHDRIDGEGE